MFLLGAACICGFINPEVENTGAMALGVFAGVIGIPIMAASITSAENIFIMVINIGVTIAAVVGAIIVWVRFYRKLH